MQFGKSWDFSQNLGNSQIWEIPRNLEVTRRWNESLPCFSENYDNFPWIQPKHGSCFRLSALQLRASCSSTLDPMVSSFSSITSSSLSATESTIVSLSGFVPSSSQWTLVLLLFHLRICSRRRFVFVVKILERVLRIPINSTTRWRISEKDFTLYKTFLHS